MNTSSKILLATCATLTILPLSASAADFEDTARVVSVAPQVEQINRPRQECRTEYVQVERQVNNNATQNNNNGARNTGGAIIGGVAGAILGNQVGGGNGRTAATAVGAIAGAIVGDRIENNGNGPTPNNNSNNGSYTQIEQQPVKTCRTVDQWETRNNGYAVTYEYHGRKYTTQMQNDPGKFLKVRVSVNPAGY
ncbi:glycine zipper 2TM domain-containing protein [Massilia sp. W12]|uniref:glycine zipper 2TM domain-containing protein n=1 Tax=Massilia sp. W12 TaxID=3126507 RepID=UPI0030D4129D